ncbi:MAG TPA: bifunctional (p)ppGpp synthetase/guanosine-3',5'-bis(diphosphate) 3'-pyrophosphohydrolase [Candidatus Fusicatenibacter intestinigallinarum]|uniref:GTP diphosphokinase n=1 Tax=Candidatus Fusicatenibacter intestinigallinarum TaxID=2838598 RepID=A0A9D2N7S2_9FIRM|nr:bifunctional (p)ppGpp synthetase/guanosine-3',5'-bis(diphosphate) 3'-pyrophosphohydrolase [Candidatus Fusicatenibacter intestinigallinarum]
MEEDKKVVEEKMKNVAQVEASVRKMEDFTSPAELYRTLVEAVKRYHPSDDLTMIAKAYKVADEAHRGQKRKSGEPYIIHPLCVAIILADLELDKESIAAGLLHDVVEDTIMTTEELEQEFGSEVALIVDGVTKLGRLNYSKDKVEEQAENLRKMFLAMAKDIRVILVKLADRLHNMRTAKYWSPEKQKEKARETMDIYAPIAQRLGISKIKVELDDLSLKYLEPEAYYDLVKNVNMKREERQAFVDSIVDDVKKKIEASGIKGEVSGRIKHFFSIYKKMVNQHKTLDQIYDLFAVRIIVDTVKDCYAALGVIHEMYTPIPGRFKDYIAMPKANMYQSLHTTLIGPSGQPFEIQIRTFEMHRTAEYGIAAHWKYKEASDGKKTGPEQEEEKLSWLRQILEWQQDMSDNHEFMSLLKSDLNLFSENVYCFTPAGDVKTLPSGSCAIDFAYSIHSAVGNQMVGARVNGKLVPIETELHNGDRVEIITSMNSKGPSRDWLKIAKSAQAKGRINQWFRHELKEDNISKGKEMLNAYAKLKGKNLGIYMKNQYQEAVMRKYGFRDWDSVLAAVGHGGLKEGQVLNKLVETYEKEHKKEITDEQVMEAAAGTKALPVSKSKGGIVVRGIHDVAVRFSKCCSPIPGDEIVGFVTRGRGVTIHRTDCINILNLPESERQRLVDAEWEHDDKDGQLYTVEINVYANNRTGLLVDISKIFTERKIDLAAINVRTSKQGTATIDMSFDVHNNEELNSLIEKVRQVESVIDIERSRG